MLVGKYKSFYENIKNVIPQKNIFTDKLHRLTYGTDASFYRLIPEIVIRVDAPQEVQAIIELANKLEVGVTFRAAGTSLSGQAISDSILVITSRKFTNFRVADDKSYISLEPALTGEQVNSILAPFEKKIGPDPASIDSAMIGGIAANNASGMCCGVAQNSYKTLKSIKLIMSDGTRLDTSSEESKEAFRVKHKTLLKKLKDLATKTKEDEKLHKLISKKFKIKNTCGYSINALVDFEDEFDILSHLIIGSEGTLAFIEEITYYTVEDFPNKASALIFFKNVEDACNAVTKLKLAKDDKKVSVAASEFMDNKSLKSVQDKPGMPEYLKDFDDQVTALLVETRAVDKENLKIQTSQIKELLNDFETVRPIEFTDVEEEYTLFWKIRKGLFPAVGAVRKIGTSVIIEDVAYPIEHLASGTLELQNCFKKHNYNEALIFGHAFDGNLHFVFTQDFSDEKEVARYDAFMNDITNSVAIKYQGSLKAEHGTGRNMAAFIELEWGNTAYKLMKDIKNIFDEKNILNPGVIINDDKTIHLKNLKPLPATNPIVDVCIECGFCEPVCPSNVLSLTPRHRIVANREISRLQEAGENEEAKQLMDDYVYDGIETCATCSLCSTVCPVGIDTGSLTKYLRAERITPTQNKIASVVANHYSTAMSGVKVGLAVSNIAHTVLGTSIMGGVTSGLRKITNGAIPKWSASLPKANTINLNFKNIKSDRKVVYFPSCFSQKMGQSKGNIIEQDLFDTTVELITKAGFEVIIPKNVENLCCGMPFASKGYVEQGKKKSDELEAELIRVSNNGEYPVICDTTACVKKMLSSFKCDVKIYDPIEFTLDVLAKYLKFEKTDEPIAIHSTCTTRKMGFHKKFIELANMCSSDVTVPANVKCCGFAGDRGFNFPELNSSALRHLKPSLKKEIKMGFSSSPTCEIGLSENSGIDYNSIFCLVNKCTKAI